MLSHPGAFGSWADGDEADGLANVGETITCTYEISNAGTQTLAEVCLIDDNVDSECTSCGATELSPGSITSCSTTYEVLPSTCLHPGNV